MWIDVRNMGQTNRSNINKQFKYQYQNQQRIYIKHSHKNKEKVIGSFLSCISYGFIKQQFII